MKPKTERLFLSLCTTMTMVLLVAFGSIASAAGGETVSMAALFTSGTAYPDYDVTDGSGNVTAYGYKAGNPYTLTVNMTAATLSSPEVVITIPANYSLDFYTPANNATISPYLSVSNPITNALNADGTRTLTYRFRDNTTAVGFTVTVTPNLKLRDGEIYAVTSELFGNGEATPVASATSAVRIFNPSVHPGAFYANGSYRTVTYTVNGPVLPVTLGGSIYANYSGLYASDEIKIVLPLPANGVPGYYDGSNFVQLSTGESRAITNGTVAYYEDYVSTNSSGADMTIPGALVYVLNSTHALCQGNTTSAWFSDANMGALYLKFPDAITATGGNKYYQSPYTVQVSAKFDGSSDYSILLHHANGYSLYYVFQEYSLSNYFYQASSSSADQYSTGSYVLPIEDNSYALRYVVNNTGETLEDIVIEYAIPQALYANKLVFGLSSSPSSLLPATADVVYKTRLGGSTEYTASMSSGNSILSLSDATDAYTYLRVTYDKLGSSSNYQQLLRIYLVNRDQLSSGSMSVASQIVSATCPTTLVASGTIGVQPLVSQYFYPNQYFDGAFPYLELSKATLNKGDTFAVRVYPSYYYTQLLTDLNIYILMPSEYVYSGFTAAYGYTGSAPVHTSRQLSVSPETATTYVPAGDYTLHTFRFDGDLKVDSYRYHSFNFEVGPLVDTATARANVYLPPAVAMSQSNDLFRYTSSATYQMVDAWDFDMDGDTSEKMAASNQHPAVTINAASALDAKSYLTTSYATGTEASMQMYQYNSTGFYKFYLYNGLASGNNASDVVIDIALPRDGSGVSYNGTTSTSTWNALLTGAPAFIDSSGFMTGAAVSYSTDGVTFTEETPPDWTVVTHVRISTADGRSLADGENVVVSLPIRADFEDDVTTNSKAYFGNSMQYKLTSSGELVNSITIAPATMQTAAVVVAGTVYHDLNANLIQDVAENGHGASYPVRLYAIAGEGTEVQIGTTYTNSTSGTYSFSVLQPGNYKIAVVKSSPMQYFPTGEADCFADDGTYVFSIDGEATGLTDVDLGILIPRTLNLNMGSTILVDGADQQIVPSITPALTGAEAVTYTSSNPEAVSVSADGLLTYVADGNATITVSVPQLPAVVAAQGEGASIALTATVAVVSQDNTHNITANPYIGSTPFASESEAITAASGTYVYSGTFYYFFNRTGYCNDPSHANTEEVTWTIDEEHTTAAGAVIAQSGSRVTLSGGGAGTVTLVATETGDHAYATPLTLTITINKADISGVSFDNLVATYDGSPKLLQITGTLPEGASISYAGNTGTNAGTYDAIATIDGGANYNGATLTATLTILKADISGVGFNKLETTYDGTPKTIAISGVLPDGATVSYTGNTATNAGVHTATATIDGGINYNDKTLTATVSINKAPLIATIGNYSRIYGEDNPDFVVTVTGFVNGESTATATGYAAPVASSVASSATGVGTYAITISGGAANNYTFDLTDTGTLTIGHGSLTIAASAGNKTYGSTYTFEGNEFSAEGLVNGDTVTFVTLASDGASAVAPVNTYEIVASGAAGTGLANYTITYSKGTITVIPKILLVSVDADQSRMYGQPDQTLTYTVTGFVNGENESVLTGALERAAGNGAGSYAISLGSLSAGSNYSINFTGADFAITKAPLTVTADDQEKVYGEADPELTYTPGGTLYYDDTYAVISGVILSTATGDEAKAGEHEIIASGGSADNYELTLVAGHLTVDPKPIDAVNIVAYNKYYDGTTKAWLRTRDASLQGVLAGDDVSLDLNNATGEFADPEIGVGKTVSVTGLALTGADAGNYVLNPYLTVASIREEPASLPTEPTGGSGVEIIVDGEVQPDAASTTVTTEDGQTVTTITLNQERLGNALQQAGENPVVTLPSVGNTDVVVGELNGQMVKDMELQAAVLEVRTERSLYNLPAAEINIDAVAAQLGEAITLSDVAVRLEIAELSPEQVQVVQDIVNQGNYALVVPPLEFSITCAYGGQTVEVTQFNHYVERTVAIPDGVDPAGITTGIVVDADGSIRHVPTQVIVIDGKYYAKINSLTNSTYSVIWNPVEFPDMVNHWAKGPVNDMASRLVMEGKSELAFDPNIAITRGEFAATIGKALGLQPWVGDNPFIDVSDEVEYAGYIITAHTYGVMSGYTDGTFRPGNTITREEAMSMVTAAMRISRLESGLQPGETVAVLAEYVDGHTVGGWASNVVAACLKSGIIGGRPGMVIAPKDNISRAETAAIMQRLLRRSGLI